MKINKFKKVGSNKYKIFFDNTTMTFYDDVILKYNLLYKKEIDDDLLTEINKENYKASIYDVAIKYIGIRMRSKKEMKEYLTKKGFDLEEIDEVIETLVNRGLLNDTLFCKSYVNDKVHLTDSGLDKIKSELIKLGIYEDVIDDAIKNIDKNILYDKLNKIIMKEIKRNTKFPINKIKNKVINKCINLGYELENINEILDNHILISNSNIKEEYEKLYKKYCNKYDEYKLKNVIKSKLYQKGYSVDEINNIINKKN